MSLYDDLRKKLTPEVFTQVTDALGDDFDYDVVPRTRLNKVIKQRRELREQLESIAQQTGQGSSSGADGATDDDDDSGVPAKNVDIDSIRQQFAQERDAEILRMRVQYAALDKLRIGGAIDPEFVVKLLDMDSVKVDGDNITGLDEQIETLKGSKSYLFGETTTSNRSKGKSGTGKGEGSDGSEGDGQEMKVSDFMKLSLDEQIAYKEAHPTVFQRMMESL